MLENERTEEKLSINEMKGRHRDLEPVTKGKTLSFLSAGSREYKLKNKLKNSCVKAWTVMLLNSLSVL